MKRAATGGEELGSWLGLYWFPLYAWARHKGWAPEDAADEVQEFLGKVCRFQLLEKADPSRGRLRAWLLKSFCNHLASERKRSRRLKRGGGSPHVVVDWRNAEVAYEGQYRHAVDAESLYARAWAMTVMEEALEQLGAHYGGTGREDLFRALLPVLESTFPRTTYDEVAVGLGMSGAALRQAAVRFRQRYRRLLLDVAAKRLGITCEARLQEELRDLLAG